MADVLFPTSIIGSMPRPAFVRDLIADDSPLTGDEYRRLMGSAVHYIVAMQEAAGLDVISDGEWWRKSYIGVIAELAHGFELSTNPADGRPWTVVVDKQAQMRVVDLHNRHALVAEQFHLASQDRHAIANKVFARGIRLR